MSHPWSGIIRDTANKLGHHGMILVLLETPSGFALFSYCGIKLYLPDAMETIWAKFVHHRTAKQICWLKDFQTFEDKSSAINAEGLDIKLADMIKNCRQGEKTLAVEKIEYKSIIESTLDITCLCDEAVKEVIWGLKNLMCSFVPGEKLELTKEDRLPMSKGLLTFLLRNGLVVKPEVVNKQIILGAKILYNCECKEKDQSPFLHRSGRHLWDVSGIYYQDWDLLKLATALKFVCSPDDNVAHDPEIFSDDELSKLKRDAQKYQRLLSKVACLRSYEEIVCARETKSKKIKELESLIEEAQQAYEAEQARKLVKLNKRKTTNEDEIVEAREAEKAEVFETHEGEQASGLRKRSKLKTAKEDENVEAQEAEKGDMLVTREAEKGKALETREVEKVEHLRRPRKRVKRSGGAHEADQAKQ